VVALLLAGRPANCEGEVEGAVEEALLLCLALKKGATRDVTGGRDEEEER